MKVPIISFWCDVPSSGSYYEDCAGRLKERCRKLNWPHYIIEMPTTGDWLSNTRLKPTAIISILADVDTPVLWVDIDAGLHQAPELINEYPAMCHVAASPFTGVSKLLPQLSIRSSTLFFNNTPEAKNVLREWKSDCSKDVDFGDHRILDRIIARYRRNNLRDDSNGLRYFSFLPTTYAIAMEDRAKYPSETWVISIGYASHASRIKGMHRAHQHRTMPSK